MPWRFVFAVLSNPDTVLGDTGAGADADQLEVERSRVGRLVGVAGDHCA